MSNRHILDLSTLNRDNHENFHHFPVVFSGLDSQDIVRVFNRIRIASGGFDPRIYCFCNSGAFLEMALDRWYSAPVGRIGLSNCQ